MKVTITYEFDPKYSNPCFARTVYDGHSLISCGKNWEEADEHMLKEIERVRTTAPLTVPLPKELEVSEPFCVDVQPFVDLVAELKDKAVTHVS